jgi:hypothetical protein
MFLLVVAFAAWRRFSPVAAEPLWSRRAELAHLGNNEVGVGPCTSCSTDKPMLAFDAAGGRRRRWIDPYGGPLVPAHPAANAPRVVYTAQLPSEPPAAPKSFSVPGIAVRDARPSGTNLPLVIVSHGYSNDPAAMTWLTENLASKGYVVAAIHHDDPPITDRTRFAEPLMRRPLDIAFVAQTLQRQFAADHWVDPSRTAMIGYSMGGYGVLSAAGAILDPQGGAVKLVPGGLMLPFARGGELQQKSPSRDCAQWWQFRRPATVAWHPGAPTGCARSPRLCCSSPAIRIRPWTMARVRARFLAWRAARIDIC